LIDHAVLRTQAIDAHLSSALASGTEQVVILGAGLDARAWRMPALHRATVFEVDHPATQRYKRARLGSKVPHGELLFIAVDFERDRVESALRKAGFQPERRTMWIWEGVAMYLARGAITDTTMQLTRLSAPGSELAMTYLAPGTLPFGFLGRTLIAALFRAGGEPLKTTFTTTELAAALGPEWSVLRDDNSSGWKRLTGSPAEPPRTFRGERLALARRR
jgi:methyltransferase (TIGR00027 family)